VTPGFKSTPSVRRTTSGASQSWAISCAARSLLPGTQNDYGSVTFGEDERPVVLHRCWRGSHVFHPVDAFQRGEVDRIRVQPA
jgi:hypothetical protein